MTSISFPQYLLESSLCLAVFYLFYHVALRRQTFFQFNRWYLLLMPFVALLIPLGEFEWHASQTIPVVEYVMPVWTEWQAVDYTVQSTLSIPAPGFTFRLFHVLMTIYLLGAGLMLVRLSCNLWRVCRIILRSRTKQKPDFILVETPEDFPAASFFGYVFWNQSGEATDEVVLQHELVHVRQWHSLDVILIECLVILMWFNPLIYAFRHRLEETHEFIADAFVSGRLGSAYQYAACLVSQRPVSSSLVLTHSFAAKLPKRLKMLSQPRSAFWRYLNYLVIIPLTAFLIMLFAYDMAGKLNPKLSERLDRAEEKLNRIGQTSLYSTGEGKNAIYTLGWDQESCNCFEGQMPNYYRCENLRVSTRTFKKLISKDHWFSLYQGGEEVGYEIMEITSKNMLQLGHGFLGVESLEGNVKFWKNLRQGDVLHMSLKLESGDYTELNVIVYPKSKVAFSSYDVYLGDVRIPIELTNMMGVKYMDGATYDVLKKQSFRLVRDGKETVEFQVLFQEPNEDDWYKETTFSEVFPGKAKKAFFEETTTKRSRRIPLRTRNGEKIIIHLFIDQGPYYKGHIKASKDARLIWADRSLTLPFGMVLKCRNFAEKLGKQPFRLVVNGQERKVIDYGEFRVMEGDQGALRTKKKLKLKSMKNLNQQLAIALDEWKAGSAVVLADLRSDKDEVFDIFLRLNKPEDCPEFVLGQDVKPGSAVLLNSVLLHAFDNGALSTTNQINGLDTNSWNTLKEIKYHPSIPPLYILNKDQLEANSAQQILDEINPANITSFSTYGPEYGEKKFGERGKYGVVGIRTKE